MRVNTVDRTKVLAWIGVALAFAATFAMILPILTTVPNEQARKHWEKNYATLLPRGYRDFRAHWQSQDIGVQIFSFYCPDRMTGDEVLRHIANKLPGFKTVNQTPNEVALRRTVTYSNPDGFDEYRFVYRPNTHRVYGMFANLDDEAEVHGQLLKKLEEISAAAR